MSIIVNQEKRVVTAIIPELHHILNRTIWKAFPGVDLNLLFRTTSKFPTKIVAQARCSDEDTFDEGYGIRLATRRADRQLAKAKYRAIGIIREELIEVMRSLDKAGHKAKVSYFSLDRQVIKIFDERSPA